MLKSRLAELAKHIAKEAKQRPYIHWADQTFPIIYEIIIDGETVVVEIDILETFTNCLQIGVSVTDERALGPRGILGSTSAGYSVMICSVSNSDEHTSQVEQ